MADYIPKEKLDAYRRWQADSFDAPRPKPIAKEAPAPASPQDGELVSGFALPTAEDIERIHNEAHQAGYQAGYDEGRTAGQQDGLQAAQQEVARMAGLLTNFETALAGLDQSVADQILELALEVARQLVQSTIQARPETLLPIISEALAALPIHHGHVSVHLNPSDAPLVRDHLGEQFSQTGSRIIEDKTVQAGGCILHAGSSEVDASLDVRWKRILEAIGVPASDWQQTP